MSNYEVQSHKNGQWVIASVQDDQDEAIYEAQRLLQGKRTTSVRVVQEIYDANSDTYRMKVIFRRARASETSDGGAGDGTKKKKVARPKELSTFGKFSRDTKISFRAFIGSVPFLIIKFAVIIGLGIWLLVSLQEVAEKL
ncbi:MAG: hypothetical protein HOO00_01990 [Rhodospirillaceae bacterium]|jgi:hypothetical protein|nr:hypothetical protein [Rhodospirillaceae bacterium]MBT5374797.1 hypothetical protein [Rhodospirillaceae bacterium]MBT5659803.1 hypothetical protein [Rhodospirillaceae bacterium]MBT5751616.1 hypothetical protein [Rhodospirillaceae bacterium]